MKHTELESILSNHNLEYVKETNLKERDCFVVHMKGDMNDGDYVTEISIVEQDEYFDLDLFLSAMKVIKKLKKSNHDHFGVVFSKLSKDDIEALWKYDRFNNEEEVPELEKYTLIDDKCHFDSKIFDLFPDGGNEWDGNGETIRRCHSLISLELYFVDENCIKRQINL